MGKIFKNLVPYWKSVVIIFALLLVQAFCDLSLPAYTSDIIDVGIQNSGISHTLPESITAQEYRTALIFMTNAEQKLWANSYNQDPDTIASVTASASSVADDTVYTLTADAKKNWSTLDSQLQVPLLLDYEMMPT